MGLKELLDMTPEQQEKYDEFVRQRGQKGGKKAWENKSKEERKKRGKLLTEGRKKKRG